MSMKHDIGILLHIKVSNLYCGVLTNTSMTHEYEDVEVCNFDLMLSQGDYGYMGTHEWIL